MGMNDDMMMSSGAALNFLDTNDPKAIVESLGGEATMREAFASNQDLKFNFGVSSDISKPVSLKMKKVIGAFVRIIRTKHPDGHVDYKVKLLFCVEKLYIPKKLADFQYLPILNDSLTNFLDYYDMSQTNHCLPEWFYEDTPIFFPTPIDSKFETLTLVEKKKQDSVDDSDTVKADGYYSATRIRFSDDKVPESLFQETIDRILCRTKENRKIYEAIIKKFDEQPIWSTNELILTLRTSVPIELKHMGFFRKVAYKFFDGPFMNLWIKKGYDPRINRSAAIYQVVPVRLKHKIRGFDSSRGNELGNVYVNTNSIPTLMCILYQYKNIDLAEAKQLLDNVIGEGDTCSYEDGWLLPGTTRKCSEIITRQIVHNYNSQFKD